MADENNENEAVMMTMLKDIKEDTKELRINVKDLDEAVRGNGQPGLKTEVAVIKARNRMTLGILVPIGLLVLGLIGRVVFEWIKSTGGQ